MIYYSLLPDRAVLAVSGEERQEFLQGLITKDMRHLKAGEAVFAALLSPQGRFLFDFFITEKDGKFLLETDRERLPELVKRLTMYRLRSKVNFETTNLKVGAEWGEGAEGTFADPRLPGLGWRHISESEGGELGDYERHRLSLGVPDGAKDLIVDRSIILEYGYDELGAVDFDKGCYIGQEVTARSKHRASLRKFVHQVRSDGALPPKGTQVMAGAREAGIMLSSTEGVGLAHLRVEEVERAHREGLPLTAGDAPLVARLPLWCKTSFADGVLTS